MTTPRQPSGLAPGLDFLFDPNWSPEHATAMFELIDDLRDRVWNHYGAQIQAVLREQRGTAGIAGTPTASADANEEPF